MDKFAIAKIGKTVGLRGELKLHLMSDFEEQFESGATFESDKQTLQIKSYNPQRGLILFEGFESIESAKTLTNQYLYSDEKQTRQNCHLGEGEKFWFELIGLEVIEKGEILGTVVDIDRIGDVEYFKIQTSEKYKQIAKTFLIPNIQEYIVEKTDALYTKDCMGILEQS